MSDLNVILYWFVLCLLLRLIFCGCFVIDGILVLITVGKSDLGLLIFFVKEMHACVDKLVNLEFIHRESFYWYNRLPYSLFLEFFINRYSLPMYRFC